MDQHFRGMDQQRDRHFEKMNQQFDDMIMCLEETADRKPCLGSRRVPKMRTHRTRVRRAWRIVASKNKQLIQPITPSAGESSCISLSACRGRPEHDLLSPLVDSQRFSSRRDSLRMACTAECGFQGRWKPAEQEVATSTSPNIHHGWRKPSQVAAVNATSAKFEAIQHQILSRNKTAMTSTGKSKSCYPGGKQDFRALPSRLLFPSEKAWIWEKKDYTDMVCRLGGV